MKLTDYISPTFTAEEALRLCELLDTLQTAIWRVHGVSMADYQQGLDALREEEPDVPSPLDDDSHLF